MNMRMISNNVLVRPDTNQYCKVKLGNTGIELEIDTQFEPEKHSVVSGEVVAIPEFLRYSETDIRGKITINTTQPDVKVGDTVLWHYLDFPEAVRWGRIMKEGDFWESKVLMAIDYKSLYLSKRGDDVRPLNDIVIVEPFTGDGIKTELLHLPQQLQKQELKVGRVAWCAEGGPKEYDFVKQGAIVYFSDYDNVPLQYEMHSIIDTTKVYYRMKFNDIIAGRVE